MKLFWGLIETDSIPEPHSHTYNSDTWECIRELTFTLFNEPIGILRMYKNVCTTCGTIVEKEFQHGSRY